MTLKKDVNEDKEDVVLENMQKFKETKKYLTAL